MNRVFLTVGALTTRRHSSAHEIFQGRILEWGAISYCRLYCVQTHTHKVKSETVSRSVVSNSLQPMDCSPPAPLSMGFPSQEYWSGLPFSSPRELPDPGIKPGSPYHLSHQGTCVCVCVCVCVCRERHIR